MTSETPNLHVSKNLNISKTKQDIEKLKTPLRLVWKCCSVVFKIGPKIFSLQWHFNQNVNSCQQFRILPKALFCLCYKNIFILYSTSTVQKALNFSPETTLLSVLFFYLRTVEFAIIPKTMKIS